MAARARHEARRARLGGCAARLLHDATAVACRGCEQVVAAMPHEWKVAAATHLLLEAKWCTLRMRATTEGR